MIKDAFLSADLDELHIRLHCAIELVRVVHTALTEGASIPSEADFEGLFGAYCLLESLDNELAGKIESLYAAMRGEVTA